MPSITVEFEVFCERCGRGLCATVTESNVKRYGTDKQYTLPPCVDCMKDTYDEGFEKGYDERDGEESINGTCKTL